MNLNKNNNNNDRVYNYNNNRINIPNISKTSTSFFYHNYFPNNNNINNNNNGNLYVKNNNNYFINNCENMKNNIIIKYEINNNFKNSQMDYDEPKILKLSEFTKINKIGEGSEGSIFSVIWSKNNKRYALKKSLLKSFEGVKKKREELNMLKNFREKTGNDGIIKVFGSLCQKTKNETYDFYELMELAQIDWDQEIMRRGKTHIYYSEQELINIMKQIVNTFALLQKNLITHRDIKPQNIMIVDGKFKICDFGNARILKKDGILYQRIRGSEMYMSPILFRGLHTKEAQVKHNTFKSDVFSLGMCFLLAGSLTYTPLNLIRESYDTNFIQKVINNFLSKRYSKSVVDIISSMLQINEKIRPDFIEVESFFFNLCNIHY
jgi:serine/threonine protein kinase